VFIWFIMAIVLLVIVIGGYGGRRKYQKSKGGGAGDNPKSHNRGHAKDHRDHSHRGRGSGR
jgi:hypothetical protein